jgi:Mn-dependent DtxR family transcriptional regulator
VLQVMGARPQEVRAGLETLARQGLVQAVGQDEWALTPAGVHAARRVVGAAHSQERGA